MTNPESFQEWEDETPKELSAVTVAEFEALCASLYEQREACDKAKDALEVENSKKSALEMKVKQYLDSMERKNYKSKLGTISIVKEVSYALPKTDEDRTAFFNYLKEKEVFDELISVNHKTYNSYIKEQREMAETEGRVLDFKIPGVGEPSVFEKIRVLKGK